MTKTTIINLPVLSASFPTLEEPQVARENLLDTIERIFLANIDLVILEGEDGAGKTNLLAQFATRYPDNTVSIFLASASRWALDPGIVRLDLCNQISWILYKRELRDPLEASEESLRTLIFNLQKLAQREGRIIYFTLDGLDQVGLDKWQFASSILDLIPLGLPRFRSIISGESGQLLPKLAGNIKSKVFRIPGFTLDETATYFSDIAIDRQDLRELVRACHGIPGRLASIKRIIRDGKIGLQEFLREVPEQLASLFEIEWKQVDESNEELLLFLSLLAFDDMPCSVDRVKTLLNLDEETVLVWAGKFSFLETNKAEQIECVSSSFKKFAERRLDKFKIKVQALIIEGLLCRPDDEDALVYLPSQFAAAGRNEELVKFLTLDKILRMLEGIQSISPIKDRVSLGVSAARQLRNDRELLKLSLASSALLVFESAEVWRSELDAYLSFQDYESALELAQRSFSKEDRLHLLVIIARHKYELGQVLESYLIDQIRNLCSQIEPRDFPQMAVDIAIDLMPVMPDVAINMVERSADVGEGENSFEWALALVSAMAFDSKGNDSEVKHVVEAVKPRLTSPRIRDLYSGMAALRYDSSAENVISVVDRLRRMGEKLYVLTGWIAYNQRRPDVMTAIDYALNIIIGSTSYSPSLRLFNDLALPLSSLENSDDIRRIVGVIEAQRSVIAKRGPTEDGVALQLSLAAAESRYSQSASIDRIMDVFASVQELRELETKLTCLARIKISLSSLNFDNTSDKDVLVVMASEQLSECFDVLFNSAARQDDIARSVLKVLARGDFDLAYKVSASFNTEWRRDIALNTIVGALSGGAAENVRIGTLFSVINDITSEELRADAFIKSMKFLILRSSAKSSSDIERSLMVMRRIQDPGDRCLAICLLLKWIEKDENDALAADLLVELGRAWESIDAAWSKIDIGFKIAEFLSMVRRMDALGYLKKAEDLRSLHSLGGEDVAAMCYTCVKLAIRIWGGLLPRNLARDEDFEILGSYIDRFPSSIIRVTLWSDMATILYINGRSSDVLRIVRDRVRPLVNSLNASDLKAQYWSSVVESTVALYCSHRSTALQDLVDLPIAYRDLAYVRISHFIMRKQLQHDPFEENPGHSYSLTYEDCIDLCELFSLIDSDWDSYCILKAMVDSIVAKRGVQKFSMQQVAEISRRIGDLVKVKFPNPRHIQHIGFVVASEAELLRLKRAPSTDWSRLLADASRISNAADREYVKIIIARGVSRFDSAQSSKLLAEIDASISNLPSIRDRVGLYQDLAIAAAETGSGNARKYIRSAWEAGLAYRGPQAISRALEIVDLAYSLDPEFAASLATLQDDDESKSVSKIIERRIEKLNHSKKLLDSPGGQGQAPPRDEESGLSAAAGRLLGLLNSEKIIPVGIERARDVIEEAAKFDLDEAEDIFSWIAQSLVVKYSRTGEAGTYLKPMWEAALSCADLVERVAVTLDSRLRPARRLPGVYENQGGILIRPGERDKAMAFLREWLVMSAKEIIKICDPYFYPWDLSVLSLVLEARPDCRVEILTSRKCLDSGKVSPPWENAYKSQWRRISALDPPDTDIVVVGMGKAGDSPIHDRWWITRGSGLRMGTSFGSLGYGKDSEIGVLSPDDALARERELDSFLARSVRVQGGEKVTYSGFTL